MDYEERDFKIVRGEKTNDKRIAYIFLSKDHKIEANFFWMANDVQVRGLIWDKDLITGTFEYGIPFANHNGGGVLPEPEVILKSIIRWLKCGNYKLLDKKLVEVEVLTKDE